MSSSSTRLKNLQSTQQKSRKSDATRSRLLKAAGEIFADVGYDATTTREICVKAGANAAAINYHFGDKLGLYAAVLQDIIGPGSVRVHEEAMPQTKPELALRQFIDAMFENLFSTGSADQYSRIMVHELSSPTPALAQVVERIIRPRAKLLSELVFRYTGQAPSSLETRLAVHSVIGQVIHYVHARAVIKMMWPTWNFDAAMRKRIVDHITEFSLAGLRHMKRPAARSRSKKRR
jgi:AcrR family transcriptional regulator